MLQLETGLGAGLLLAAVAGASVDVSRHRIPNLLTVSAFVLALAIRLLWGDGAALLAGLLAAAIAFALSFPLFALHALGGGDVKFLTAVCAFLGMERLWTGLAAIAIAGGVLALVVAIRRNSVQRTFSQLGNLVRSLAYAALLRKHPVARQTLATPGALKVPYGVAIAVGAVVGFYW
ncbi:MAG: prepilin peptidase [Gemmatimonadota bacterium]|nr:prepilin peptidase [Gemmatimonadota bacterium]